MPASTLTWESNSPAGMIWNPSATSSCTSIADPSPGKASRLLPRSKNTKKSVKRKCPHLSRFCAKGFLQNLPCISTTAAVFDSKKVPIICICVSCSVSFSALSIISTIILLIGPCWNKRRHWAQLESKGQPPLRPPRRLEVVKKPNNYEQKENN